MEATIKMPTEPAGKPLSEIAGYAPGYAIIYKGEPSATELGMLRFGFTHQDLTRVSSIVVESMKRYKEFDELSKDAANERIDSVVKVMKSHSLATPLHYSSQEAHSNSEAQGGFPSASKFIKLLRRLDPRKGR